MTVATTILFRGITRSDALQAAIHAQVAKLSKFAEDIDACKVVVATDGHRHQQGTIYRITIHLMLGRRELDSGAMHAHDDRHTDPYVALSDAFDAMRRRIEELAQRRHSEIRSSRAPM